MKLEELYDFDCKSTSKVNQRKLFGKTMMKVKNSFLLVMLFLICIGFYYVEKKGVNQKMTKLEDQVSALQNFINDVKINNHMTKRDVKIQSHMNKRSAVDSDEELGDDLTSSSRGGATYIRWGSRNCEGPENTKIVYQGEAAGSEHEKTGGGSNIICIDHNISYTPGKYINGNQGGSLIYGIEYWFSSSFNRLFDFSRTEGESVHRFNIPCAVCMATGTVNQLMIPGRETCPPYWKKEYTGYIMGGHNSHKHSQPYLCVDDTPQVVLGSDALQNDGGLYMVETQCPSLQCEPFVPGREVRCVVCTI